VLGEPNTTFEEVIKPYLEMPMKAEIPKFPKEKT